MYVNIENAQILIHMLQKNKPRRKQTKMKAHYK